MIARSEWFKPRKYTGWGVTPKTWQGWIYIAAIIGSLIIIQALPFWSDTTRLWIIGAWVLFLLLDILPLMPAVTRDEREKQHEAIAERNAAWAITFVLAIGIVVELTIGALQEQLRIPWVAAIALFVGLAVKAASNIYLERHD